MSWIRKNKYPTSFMLIKNLEGKQLNPQLSQWRFGLDHILTKHGQNKQRNLGFPGGSFDVRVIQTKQN